MGSSIGTYKMNTRGVSKWNQNGYGGILRDENGFWKRGFMGHLESDRKRIDAELWAVFKGVELIDILQLQNTTLEAESLSVFDALEKPDLYTRSPFLVEKILDCQKLIKKHNRCVDFLAKLAMENDDDDEYGYEDVLDPLPGIECLIMVEKGNVNCD